MAEICVFQRKRKRHGTYVEEDTVSLQSEDNVSLHSVDLGNIHNETAKVTHAPKYSIHMDITLDCCICVAKYLTI